jgi:hypothetical protein
MMNVDAAGGCLRVRGAFRDRGGDAERSQRGDELTSAHSDVLKIVWQYNAPVTGYL